MNALRAEWIKIHTLRSTRVSYIIVVALTLGLAALVASASSEPQNSEVLSGLAGITGGVPGPGLIVLLIVATVSITGEWRVGTMRTTFISIPQRFWAITAKALVVGSVGAIVGFLSALLGIIIGGVLAHPEAVEAGFSGDLRLLWTVPVTVFIGTFFSTGMGCIVRHSAGAITLLAVWMLVLETLSQALVVGLSQRSLHLPPALLPFTSMEAFVTGRVSSIFTTHTPEVSLLIFIVWSAAVFLVGIIFTQRNDP